MAKSTTEKYSLQRLSNSYYQKITTVSGFFTKKTSEWDDLYVKGNRYCASGWLHSTHKDYISLLNMKYYYSVNEMNHFIMNNKTLWQTLNDLCLNRADKDSDTYFSFKFLKRAFTGAKYKDKSVDEINMSMNCHYSNSGCRIEDDYGVLIKFSNGDSEYLRLSSTDGKVLTELISLGLLTQLDKNPNCIFYYIYSDCNIVDYAKLKGWIR